MEYPITNKFLQEEAKTLKDAKRMLVLANRILANEGIFDAYGHISVRNPENPETLLITRSLSPEFVTVDDIITLDFEGNVVSEDKTRQSFLERFIHCSIYRERPDVVCVAHPHPPELITFSATGLPYRSIYHQEVTFFEGLPVFDGIPPESGMLINNMEVADALTKALGNKRGVLVQNHGAVIVGESIPRTIYSAITLRDGVKMLMSALLLNAEPTSISRETQEYGMYNQYCTQALNRSWNYWNVLAKRAFSDIADLEH